MAELGNMGKEIEEMNRRKDEEKAGGETENGNRDQAQNTGNAGKKKKGKPKKRLTKRTNGKKGKEIVAPEMDENDDGKIQRVDELENESVEELESEDDGDLDPGLWETGGSPIPSPENQIRVGKRTRAELTPPTPRDSQVEKKKRGEDIEEESSSYSSDENDDIIEKIMTQENLEEKEIS